MATIHPFKALHYTEQAGDLTDLVSPPHDVLTEQQRLEHRSKSPYNIVHLTLPEQEVEDRSKFIKYARSAAKLAHWRNDGQLSLDTRPTYLRYTQEFKDPTTQVPLRRYSLVTLLKLEPYEKGIVLPHEQTFPKHKEDRLRLLEATNTHLESIFGLFEDDNETIERFLAKVPTTPLAKVQTEDGILHIIERIDGPETLHYISELLAPQRIWIADGHHRYETALDFRNQFGEQPKPIAADYILISLSSMKDPGLLLLPTHRILNHLPFEPEELKAKIETTFRLKLVPSTSIMEKIEHAHQQGTVAFGLVLPKESYLLESKTPRESFYDAESSASERLQLLDISILQNVILKDLLGIQPTDSIFHTQDAKEAIDQVTGGRAAAALLTLPSSIEDMCQIASKGEKMPQKSTHYYPKILSGLFMWSLSDFV